MLRFRDETKTERAREKETGGCGSNNTLCKEKVGKKVLACAKQVET